MRGSEERSMTRVALVGVDTDTVTDDVLAQLTADEKRVIDHGPLFFD